MLKRLMKISEVTDEINQYKKENKCHDTDIEIFTQSICGEFVGIAIKYGALHLQVFQSDDDRIDETNEMGLIEQAKKEAFKIAKHYDRTYNVTMKHETC